MGEFQTLSATIWLENPQEIKNLGYNKMILDDYEYGREARKEWAEQIWENLVSLQRFQRNLIKAKILNKKDIKKSEEELNADGSALTEKDELRQRYGI